MSAPNLENSAPSTEHRSAGFVPWLEHFRSNPAYHRLIEAGIDWDAPLTLDPGTIRAFTRSFQRFELGESGEGKRLLAKAALHGDPVYLAALELLVREEQKHSALFGRGLQRLQSPSLDAHWSDGVFTFLRRRLGLRTELGLFLIVESVAMGYFTALAEAAPDPVLRGIGLRIATDERNHIRFQIDRLHRGFARTPRAGKLLLGLTWTAIAAGSTAVLVVDHGPALRACGLSPARYWRDAMGEFGRAARLVLANRAPEPLGPIANDFR